MNERTDGWIDAEYKTDKQAGGKSGGERGERQDGGESGNENVREGMRKRRGE